MKENTVTSLSIVGYGYYLGIYSLLSADFKIAAKRLILPVNYWRVAIFKFVAQKVIAVYKQRDNEFEILDIGSPKLISLYAAHKTNASVYATDLCDETIFTEWKRYWENTTDKSNLKFEYADAKSLKYKDNKFDAAISLSVIHMVSPAQDGDITALREITRTIKPGGLLIIEVPFRIEYAENYRESDNFEDVYKGTPLFSERQYDACALQKRIIDNVDGELVDQVYFYERLPVDEIWGRFPKFITSILAFIEPWMDIANIAVACSEHQKKNSKSVLLTFKINE